MIQNLIKSALFLQNLDLLRIIMKTLADYSDAELKLIYNLLSVQVPVYPELIESYLLRDLQQHLLAQAQAEGIETSSHAAWTEWLCA